MNTKCIIVKNDDGSCSVTHPAQVMFNEKSKDRVQLADKGILVNATDDKVLEWIKNKDAPKGTIVEISSLPNDRYFRDAWACNDSLNGVSVDMPKACNIHMNNLRVVRNKMLYQLDIDYMRADERGDIKSKADVSTKKQQLRDIPQKYDLTVAKTPDELKNMIPDLLK